MYGDIEGSASVDLTMLIAGSWKQVQTVHAHLLDHTMMTMEHEDAGFPCNEQVKDDWLKDWIRCRGRDGGVERVGAGGKTSSERDVDYIHCSLSFPHLRRFLLLRLPSSRCMSPMIRP